MRYDVAIIGGGPAGLTASIFTCRAGLKTICFEKLAIGGQAALSYDIANYPGFESISGFDLCEKFFVQAKNAGLNFEYDDVVKLSKTKTGFSIKTKENVYSVKKVIIASGCKARKMGWTNEKKLLGKGVSYCASCDGGFFKDKIVSVIGGGDSAVENVVYLSRVAKKVYLFNRSEKFKAQTHSIEKIKKLDNVEIVTSAVVKEIVGDKQLEEIVLEISGKRKKLKMDGVFVAIGHEPDLTFLDLDIELDKFGYIKVDENQQTNIENVFACGDIVSKKFKQVITACADGARAGNSCIGD